MSGRGGAATGPHKGSRRRRVVRRPPNCPRRSYYRAEFGAGAAAGRTTFGRGSPRAGARAVKPPPQTVTTGRSRPRRTWHPLRRRAGRPTRQASPPVETPAQQAPHETAGGRSAAAPPGASRGTAVAGNDDVPAPAVRLDSHSDQSAASAAAGPPARNGFTWRVCRYERRLGSNP